MVRRRNAAGHDAGVNRVVHVDTTATPTDEPERRRVQVERTRTLPRVTMATAHLTGYAFDQSSLVDEGRRLGLSDQDDPHDVGGLDTEYVPQGPTQQAGDSGSRVQ